MAKRLRIALVTERFGRKFGGAEAYAVHLFKKLSCDHDLTVIAREFDHDLPIKEIHVQKINSWPGWIRALHFAFWSHRLTRQDAGFDVVHTHAMGLAGDVHVFHVVPIKFRRFFLQATWRGLLSCLEPRNLAYLWLEAASTRTSTDKRIVAVSPSVQDQLLAAYPSIHKVEVIPPGAHPVSVDSETRKRVRAQLGWSASDVGCLLVARNPMRKGLTAVTQALKQLPAHFKLAVVGADEEVGIFFKRQYPELLERVNLIDPVSDVSPFYQCADIYVHPTLRDSFGMAPLEAMAHGLPVVLSAQQYCGFAAFVQHRHNAWVLDDPKDASSIATALLALDPQQTLGAQFVQQSAVLVETFSWDAVAKRYEELYLAVIRARKSRQSQPRTQ